MTHGSLVMFPDEVLHSVNPYHGVRPRITLAWNVNEPAMEGSPFLSGVEIVAE